jgi:hypothetical protein
MSLLLILLRPHLHDRRPSCGQRHDDLLAMLAARRNFGLSGEDQVGTRYLVLTGRGGRLEEGQ